MGRRRPRDIIRLPGLTGLWASSGPPRGYRYTLVFGVLIMFMFLVSGLVIQQGLVGFQVLPDGSMVVQDFASHTTFSRAVLEGEAASGQYGSAYSPAFHLAFMSAWTGAEATAALPFGYSPTMFWVLLPFSLLPLSLAFALWTGAGFLATGWMVSRTRFHWLLGLAVFLTPISARAAILGQTVFLTTAGIYFLSSHTLRPSGPSSRRTAKTEGALIVVLWALSAKPPLAVTAGAAMLALGYFRPVFLAVLLAAAGALAASPYLGQGWISDYIGMIAGYDSVRADPAFGWSLGPGGMSNLRAFLSTDLGISDAVASPVSNSVWLLFLVGLIFTGLRRPVRPSLVWAIAVLGYLLFCSHVNSPEELLLVVTPALAVPWDQEGPKPEKVLFWLGVPVALLLSPAYGPLLGWRPSLLYLFELGLLVWLMVRVARDPREGLGGREGEALASAALEADGKEDPLAHRQMVPTRTRRGQAPGRGNAAAARPESRGCLLSPGVG